MNQYEAMAARLALIGDTGTMTNLDPMAIFEERLAAERRQWLEAWQPPGDARPQ